MPEKMFITISPPNRTIRYSKLKFANPNKCIYIDDISIIKNAFRRNKIKHYVVYPEFDKKGRLHYHIRVTVTPSQKVSLHKSVKPLMERIGFVDMEPVKHDIQNLIYCMKSFYETKQILDIETPEYGVTFKLKKIPNIRGGDRGGIQDLDILTFFK